MVLAAQQRVAEHVEKKRLAERDWIARNYPKVTGPAGGVLTEQLAAGHPAAIGDTPGSGGPLRARYRGSEIRYVGDVLGRTVRRSKPSPSAAARAVFPALQIHRSHSPWSRERRSSTPASMPPSPRCSLESAAWVIVPAAMGYGRAGLYPPETPGKRRFVVSPNALLVYDVEVLANQ